MPIIVANRDQTITVQDEAIAIELQATEAQIPGIPARQTVEIRVTEIRALEIQIAGAVAIINGKAGPGNRAFPDREIQSHHDVRRIKLRAHRNPLV